MRLRVDATTERFTLPLSSRAYHHASALLSAAIALAVLWLIALLLPAWGWVVPTAWVITGLVAVSVTYDLTCGHRWQQQRFLATFDGDVLVLEAGKIFYSRTVVARDSILSAKVESGPLLRRWGLLQLSLSGLGELPSIPAMAKDDAARLQRLLGGHAEQEPSGIGLTDA